MAYWITIPPGTESAGFINSVQNGMLLGADIHSLFDNYVISINPGVGMARLWSFSGRLFRIIIRLGVAGRHLDQKFLEDPR